jgi:hypothetical protein
MQFKENVMHSQQQLQLFKSKYEEIARTAETHLKDLQSEKSKTKHLSQV